MSFKAGDIIETTFMPGRFLVMMYRPKEDPKSSMIEYMIALPDDFKIPTAEHKICDVKEGFFKEYKKAGYKSDWPKWIAESPGSEKYVLVGQRYMWVHPEEIKDPFETAEEQIIKEIGL